MQDQVAEKPALVAESPGEEGVPVERYPRRKRAPFSSGRPRWLTLLSVAAKNAAPLAVLIYLGDQAWRWAHPATLAPLDQAALAGYNARVDDVEASLVRAFRGLQLQLEAVDRKIDGEVGAARGDLAALLDEKRLALEGHLNLLHMVCYSAPFSCSST
ncbi:uncharacterized protein LOC124706904 [Lolium rigidum]|uniref:uncharacterized protein LOC124706904 n=1 Tax=Lolium rigidum TaxID=89674 RepID=UPI001F5E180C|nr:uncharacterized protein LOC124706904 [Lolium rigidum]